MHSIKKWATPVAAAVLAACGGGGGGGVDGGMSTMAGRLIDGYIKGAKVCLDVNSNLACDPTEPSTITTEGGRYTLSYAGSVDGLRILAVVEPGEGVIDEDLGPVEKAFNLLTPAESPTVLSPLTTMVAIEMSSKGVTAAEATTAIKTALNLQATNLLGYDFKAASVSGADSETLKIAQVAVSALASVQEELKNNPATADLKSGEQFKAAVKQVQTAILPTLMKSDGTLNIDISKKTPSQLATLVKSESNLTNVISGQIQQIVANTKAGDGTRVDLAQLLREGLVIASIRSGDYINKQNVRVNGSWGGFNERLTVESLKFDIDTLNAPPEYNEWVSLVVNGTEDWYKTYEESNTKHAFNGTDWVTTQKQGIFEFKPKIEGNCLLEPLSANSNQGEKFCAVAKNVSGQKIKNYVSNICKDESENALAQCNPDGVFPENSFGYDFNITATTDLYTVYASGEWRGYSYIGQTPTLENFILGLQQNPQWTGSGCSIGFKVKDFKDKSGTMEWGENTSTSCSNSSVRDYVETTRFAVEKIGNKDIMKVMLPNVYRKQNPGESGLYQIFGVFPMAGNPNVLGIYSGDFMPKDTVISLPFGNVNANTQVVNRTLFNAVMPYINIKKPFPF